MISHYWRVMQLPDGKSSRDKIPFSETLSLTVALTQVNDWNRVACLHPDKFPTFVYFIDWQCWKD
jgi:hypothetical protein